MLPNAPTDCPQRADSRRRARPRNGGCARSPGGTSHSGGSGGSGGSSDSGAPGGGARCPRPVAAPAAAVKVTLKVVKADSEETAGQNGQAANAVDGDKDTIWHTQWQDANPVCPHEIIIELTPAATISGFTYLPRQDDSENGTIKDYEFYVSNDAGHFGQPVAKGTFENTKELKRVTFAPQACQFIKLKALSEVNDGAWTSAAEIGVIQP